MKYKKSNDDWFLQIDEAGNKTEFNQKNKPGIYAEMLAWVEAGNEIEEQFTAEELAAKEAAENQAALDSQKSECIRLLNESEKSVSQDPPYPDDIQTWKNYRANVREILKSDELKDIPPKPF